MSSIILFEETFAKPPYAENNTDANENLIEFTNAICIGNLRKNGWDNHDHDLSRDGHVGPMLVHIIPWVFWIGFLCRFLDVCCRLSSQANTKNTKGEAYQIDKCSMSKTAKCQHANGYKQSVSTFFQGMMIENSAMHLQLQLPRSSR